MQEAELVNQDDKLIIIEDEMVSQVLRESVTNENKLVPLMWKANPTPWTNLIYVCICDIYLETPKAWNSALKTYKEMLG